MLGKVLLPNHLHRFDGLGPESRVSFVSWRVVIELKQIGSAKRLGVKKLEGRFFPGIIDQCGPRISGAAKSRIVIVANTQIQDQVLPETDFILGINRKYIGG